jgi:hypothetical protein
MTPARKGQEVLELNLLQRHSKSLKKGRKSKFRLISRRSMAKELLLRLRKTITSA